MKVMAGVYREKGKIWEKEDGRRKKERKGVEKKKVEEATEENEKPYAATS